MSKLETITIDTPSGSNALQIGDGNTATIGLGKSGDTINIPAGATIANAGTATGFGGANTPNFFVSLTNNVGITDNTITKIPFNTEVFDTDNAFDNSSNYRFTVPSGKAGKYYFTFQGQMGILKHYQITIYLRKNGSTIGTEAIFPNGYEQSADNNIRSHYTTLLNLVAGDYIEMYVKINNNGTQSAFLHGDNFVTFFTGFRLVE